MKKANQDVDNLAEPNFKGQKTYNDRCIQGAVQTQTPTASSTPVSEFTDPGSCCGHDIIPNQPANIKSTSRPNFEKREIINNDNLVVQETDRKQDGRKTNRNKKEDAHQLKKDKSIKNGISPEEGVVVVKKQELLSIPQTNFAIGLLVMCCFNPIFGLLSVYLSLRSASAYRDGEKRKGSLFARMSIVISLLGIMLTMVVISSVVLYIAVNKHSARRGLKILGSTSLGF